MFKVSNKNTKKRCLLISKISLKTSERRHLTTSYLLQVTVQNGFSDSFSQNIYQFAIRSLLSVLLSSSTACNFKNSRPQICHFMRNEKSLPKYLIHENSKCQYFFYFRKNSPKFFFNFLPYIQRVTFQYHNVRYLSFL